MPLNEKGCHARETSPYRIQQLPYGKPCIGSREFLNRLPDALRERLPAQWQGFQVVPPFASLIKFYYAHRSIHYEVWLQRRTGIVEIGLHFEADPADNARWLEVMGRNYAHIRRSLGPRVEAEQWTQSWTRIHESLPLEPLTSAFHEKIADRLALMIQTLQPILEKEAEESLQ